MIPIYVVGCGGIGQAVISMLPEVISDLCLDLLEKQGVNITKYMSDDCSEALPCFVSKLVLIDGDTFTQRNALRQGGASGSKVAQRIAQLHSVLEKPFYDLNRKIVRRYYLSDMLLEGVPKYITPENMEQVIPKTYAKPNTGIASDFKKDTVVVFMCVDNKKTRYELSKYAEQFHNILVINGGNELTTGHATIYERREGIALDPNLTDIYSDITATADLRPDEVHCDMIAPKHDQTLATNTVVATLMVNYFSKWVHGTIAVKNRRQNEVIVDMDELTMYPIHHPIS